MKLGVYRVPIFGENLVDREVKRGVVVDPLRAHR